MDQNLDGGRYLSQILRQYLYYLEKYGPVAHAKERNFQSVWGLKCNLKGLIDSANSVDETYAKKQMKIFNAINWPV